MIDFQKMDFSKLTNILTNNLTNMGNTFLRSFPVAGESAGDYELLHEDLTRNLRFFQHLPTRRQIVIREIAIQKRYMMDNLRQTFSNRQQNLKHPHLFEIFGTEHTIHPSNCNTVEKMVVMSEYSQRNLQDETEERSLQRRRFAEEELWTILASCILAFSHLEKNNIRHECLKSAQVFISSDGIIKIKDPITTGSIPNLEQLMIDKNSPHLYISPELCGSLAMSQPNHTYDPHKSDVFTLGMIILEAGLLQYQDSCYQPDWTSVDWKKLENNWNIFKHSYSEQLADIVIDCMLDRNPKTRSGWSQLEANIKVFDERERSRVQTPNPLTQIQTKRNIPSPRQIEFRDRQKVKQNSKLRFTSRQFPLLPNMSPPVSPSIVNRRANYHHQKQPSNAQNSLLVHKSSSNSPTLHPFKLISRKNYVVRKPIQPQHLVKMQNSIKRRILEKSPKYELKETLKFQNRDVASPASRKENRMNQTTLQFGHTKIISRMK